MEYNPAYCRTKSVDQGGVGGSRVPRRRGIMGCTGRILVYGEIRDVAWTARTAVGYMLPVHGTFSVRSWSQFGESYQSDRTVRYDTVTSPSVEGRRGEYAARILQVDGQINGRDFPIQCEEVERSIQ